MVRLPVFGMYIFGKQRYGVTCCLEMAMKVHINDARNGGLCHHTVILLCAANHTGVVLRRSSREETCFGTGFAHGNIQTGRDRICAPRRFFADAVNFVGSLLVRISSVGLCAFPDVPWQFSPVPIHATFSAKGGVAGKAMARHAKVIRDRSKIAVPMSPGPERTALREIVPDVAMEGIADYNDGCESDLSEGCVARPGPFDDNWVVDQDDDWFNWMTRDDFFTAFRGNRLGAGLSRVVFEPALDRAKVVKIEPNPYRPPSNNIGEWSFWQMFGMGASDDIEISKWLSPVQHIGLNGRVLIQDRTKPVCDADLLPEGPPEFISDLKVKNFGPLGDRVACRDFANIAVQITSTMRQAENSEWRAKTTVSGPPKR